MGHLQESIVKHLKENKELNAMELAILCNATKHDVLQSLNRLVKWGVVDKKIKNKQTVWFLKRR